MKILTEKINDTDTEMLIVECYCYCKKRNKTVFEGGCICGSCGGTI